MNAFRGLLRGTVSVGVAIGLTACSSQMQCLLSEIDKQTSDRSGADFGTAVASPLGAYILMSYEDQSVCAVRFTGSCRDDGATGPIPLNADRSRFSADYESYYSRTGIVGLNEVHAVRRKGSVATARHFGITHSTGFSTGSAFIMCGEKSVIWTPPYSISMYYFEGGKMSRGATRLAPTQVVDLANLDAAENHLQWYLEKSIFPPVTIKNLPK